ncbi:MAG: tRNA (guanosine(46)-N7)-methyltransferase TrmB [Clostridia bacterium]|nr:tRNA (guanosine(46)-N7)-methyltransferase TrmB [Clostridia bacterium]
MRIRRKKHLKERLNNVSDILFVADFDIPNSNLAILDKKYFDFEAMYGNTNSVCLEIGCGKGLFACESGRLNPNKNYLAVELLDNIIVMACERCKDYKISNVRFFNCGAEYLPRYIKDGSISTIYLNFSPPFPGDRYENRRLTCDRLMAFYLRMLINGGEIELKTDDKEFFEYSFNQMIKFDLDVVDLTEKLACGNVFSVETEYEKKFKQDNMRIYYFKTKRKHSN